jgi:hypothetical protein
MHRVQASPAGPQLVRLRRPGITVVAPSKLFLAHHWALARAIVIVLPLILGACTNGGGGGSGY